jgi:hypothetical protein
MNYQSLIFRTHEVINKNNCTHGLEKSICGFCNGKFLEKKKSRITAHIDSETLQRYEELKSKFRSFQDLWNEDEFLVVYMNLKDVRGTKDELSAIYRTAIELERTIGAIRWAISHIFSTKVDLHRGRIVIEFRKELGLDKGI